MKISRLSIVLLLMVAVILMLVGLFRVDRKNRDDKLVSHAQLIAMPAGCIQSKQEFIQGEFLPLDEILLRSYDCSAATMTVDEAAQFFAQKGLLPQDASPKEYKYVLVGHKNNYYLKIILDNKSAAGSAKPMTIQAYTGFGSYGNGQ